MATIKGIGVVFGVAGFTFTGFHATEPTSKIQSIDLTRDANETMLMDESDDSAGVVFSNLKKTLSLNVIPTGATIAAAYTNLGKYVPSPGTVVTCADAGDAGTPYESTNTGKYLVRSARVSRTNSGLASIALELFTTEANDITAAVS